MGWVNFAISKRGKVKLMNKTEFLDSVTMELKRKLLTSSGLGFFIGAGMSVSSGIFTFRGANQEEYFDGYPPAYLCTMEMFKEDPEICWRFFRKLYQQCYEAKPSIAHRTIVAWQKKCLSRTGTRFHLITSNFDGLLSKAGAENVFELHGNINEAKCLDCKRSYDMKDIGLNSLPPKCNCGSILKPNITLLNDYVDENSYDEIKNVSCGIYFCIGTSGVNNHALNFFQHVKDKRMAKMIEINPCNTNLTKDMDYVLRGNAEDILPQFGYGTIE